MTPTEFSHRLRELLEANCITASDLARYIWGDDEPTPAGFVPAKNRDRISKCLAGKAYPDADTLVQLAQVLNVTEEELLAPQRPDVRMTVIDGHPDRVEFALRGVLPLEVALKIAALLREAPPLTD